MRIVKRLQHLACGCLLATAACSFQFDPQYLVKSRRILAIQTDPPEILIGASTPDGGTPGGGNTVNVKALVVDPSDDGTPVPYVWRTCSESFASFAPKLANWDTVQRRCLENDATLAI